MLPASKTLTLTAANSLYSALYTQSQGVANTMLKLTAAQQTALKAILATADALWQDLSQLQAQCQAGDFNAAKPKPAATVPVFDSMGHADRMLGIHFVASNWQPLGVNGPPLVTYDAHGNPTVLHDWTSKVDDPAHPGSKKPGVGAIYVTSLDVVQIALQALAGDADGATIAARLSSLQSRAASVQHDVNALNLAVPFVVAA